MAARVLCADSDPRVCEILRESLLGQGYEVETCRDGDTASERLCDEAYDLALIDVQLASRDGFQVLEQVRRQPSPMCDIPVFLLSPTRITPAYQQRGRQGGATAMLVKPVPLGRLHGLIRKHAKEGPPRVDTEESTPIPSQSSPFDGSFQELDFASLLHHLHGLRATGVLLMTNAGRRKVVSLREGYPVAVKSNLLGECLGNRLVERGLITQQDFDESVIRMQSGEGLQGQILIAMEVLDEAAVGAALLEQAEQKLLEVFTWRRGRFEFKPAAQLKGGIALPRDRSPATWVQQGVIERMPIELIDRKLRKEARKVVVNAETSFYRLQDIELDAATRALLERVDAAATPAAAPRVAALMEGDETLRRALYGLWVTGLIETRTKPTKSPLRKSSRRLATGKVDDRELRTELAAAAERMRRLNEFEILGVAATATTSEIEAAFEKVATRYHPDRFREHSAAVRSLGEGVFASIEAARARLCDPKSRVEVQFEVKQGQRRQEEERDAERLLEAELEFQRGEELLRARSYAAALRRFGAALERAPGEGEYHAHYGWCLYLIHPDESSMVQEAVEHVKRGLKLARDNEKPYLFLGRLHKATGNTLAAEKMFTRAVQLRPESVEALRELRLINMRRNKQGLIGRILRR